MAKLHVSVLLIFPSIPCSAYHWWICITDIGTKGYGLPGKISNIKVILNGGHKITFLRPDGFFSLYPTTSLVYASVFRFDLWIRLVYIVYKYDLNI